MYYVPKKKKKGIKLRELSIRATVALPLKWDQKASMSTELLDTSCGGGKIIRFMVKN